ncbi:MAG: hypothetical protein M0R66_09980, partial [Candidatus Omnitrophica bacterium]|nr:hypothetical protein [Candidatus Omnitrophota bacterium]
MSTRKFGDFFNEDDDDDALVGKLEVVTPSVTHVIKTAEEKFNTYGLKTVSPDALPDTTHKGVAEYLLQHGPAFKYAADNEALYVWDGARFSLQDSYFAFFRVLDQLVADVADALDVERGGKGKRGKKKDDEEETPRVKYLKELLRKLKTKSFAKDVLEYLKFQRGG